jgi:signal transduction histidine kinase
VSANGPMVLVVEDDPDHRALICRHLARAGVPTRWADNGVDAMARLEGVDLVLLDQKLPDTTGLEVLRRIREEHPGGPAGGAPSVVMVTGLDSTGLIVEAMRAGAADYVVKDANYLAALPAVVERTYRHHDTSRRAQRLEQLALTVTSATDPERISNEIVEGARELLGAEACALVLRDPTLEVVATAGEPEGAVAVARRARPPTGIARAPGELSVRLPTGAGETLGVLVVRDGPERVFTDEEVRLAETFASYAGIALDRLRQHELERALIAELQRAIDQRQDFIASISHELRTPIACILGFAETLGTYEDRLPPEERTDMLGRIGRHALELRDLVDQLLEVATRERGLHEVDLQEVELRAAVAAAVEDLRPVLEDREVRTDVAEVAVAADPGLLVRVIGNLLSNAAKYSDADSPIDVRAVEDGDGHVRVEVEDHGIGMSSVDVDRVFEPFWRSQQSARDATRGTGIGLALVRDYVRRMGGEVAVRSELGVGSTFSFTLPSARPQQPELVPPDGGLL